MTTAAYEFETELNEGFFESVATAARTGRRHGGLALLAMKAARAALVEGNRDSGNGRESEWESESEAELFGGGAVTPTFSMRDAVPAAYMMEHLGHAAAEAESNGEAFAFLAPLLPMALKALPLIAKKIGAKVLPRVISAVTKAAPKLIKGLDGAAKVLRTNPATKQLVRALPNVVRQTTGEIARQIAAGNPVNAEKALQLLAKRMADILGNPSKCMNAVSVAKKADARVHRTLTKPCTCS